MVVKPSSRGAWINVAVIGPYQQGKSTLTGFLLDALLQISREQVEKADHAANRKDPSRKFAFLLDHKAYERVINANGCSGTQDTSWWRLERNERHYILMNCPGRHPRIISRIGALSDADAVLLVVDTGAYLEDVRQGAGEGHEKQNVPDTITQVSIDLSLARFYGIEQLIVALHKMDKVGFSERSYQEAKAHLEGVIEKLGWSKSEVRFVPTAIIAVEERGYNIIEPAPVFSGWSEHSFLLKAIEQLHPQSLSTDAQFRMQLHALQRGVVKGLHLIATGKIAAGAVQVDDELLIQPSGIHCKVDSILPIDNSKSSDSIRTQPSLAEAVSGEPIYLRCTIIDGDAKVNKGEVAVPTTSSLLTGRRLKAELTTLASRPLSESFKKNLSGIFVMGHFFAKFHIDDLSFDTGAHLQHRKRKSVQQNREILLEVSSNPGKASILCELRLSKQAPLETYAENSYYGCFVLLDSNSFPIFGGRIIEVL